MVDKRYSPYPEDDKIIPYSPRRRFGFVSPIYGKMTAKIINLESMQDMSIDQIVALYRDGYIIEGLPETAYTVHRQIKFGLMDEQKKYGFIGQESQGGIENTSPTIMTAQDGIYISTGAILLGVGLIALFYYLKSKGKI